MQPVNCAAGAVITIGHMRVGTVDIPAHISVDFSVAFVQRFTYCGLSELAVEVSCGPFS
jgi:glycosylphosphatidylinositol transamidase (GPIT) subunit GPI8